MLYFIPVRICFGLFHTKTQTHRVLDADKSAHIASPDHG